MRTFVVNVPRFVSTSAYYSWFIIKFQTVLTYQVPKSIVRPGFGYELIRAATIET